MNYKYITETFLMDNKHRKLFVIKRAKRCKFRLNMPKVHQNTFGGRKPPGPAGGAYALLRPLAAIMRNGGVLLRGTEEREGRREGTEQR